MQFTTTQSVNSSFQKILVPSAFAIFFATCSLSHAGEMIGFSWFSGVASVAGTSVAPPVAPNNDNVVGDSPNVFFLTQKDYHAIGPVDLVFDVRDTGGTTEYYFQEGVQNSTGLDWTGYHLELGFGTGAGFVKSTAGDGLDFDSPDFDSTIDMNPGPGFSVVTTPTEDDIVASSGLQPNGAFAGYYVFHIDVPDGIDQFTLRQSPIGEGVPEPSAAILIGMSLLGSVGLRRR